MYDIGVTCSGFPANPLFRLPPISSIHIQGSTALMDLRHFAYFSLSHSLFGIWFFPISKFIYLIHLRFIAV